MFVLIDSVFCSVDSPLCWCVLFSAILHLGFIAPISLSLISFFFLINLFIYFWLCWVSASVRGLPPAAASRIHSSSRCAGLPLLRPLPLRSTGSRRACSVVVAHGPSRSAACGILPEQGSNACPLHWQADSQPLRHQGSPISFSFIHACLQYSQLSFHLDLLPFHVLFHGYHFSWIFLIPEQGLPNAGFCFPCLIISQRAPLLCGLSKAFISLYTAERFTLWVVKILSSSSFNFYFIIFLFIHLWIMRALLRLKIPQ